MSKIRSYLNHQPKDGITKDKETKVVSFFTFADLHELAKRYCKSANIKVQDFYTDAIIGRLLSHADREFIINAVIDSSLDTEALLERLLLTADYYLIKDMFDAVLHGNKDAAEATDG